jgi:hypothetical protein
VRSLAPTGGGWQLCRSGVTLARGFPNRFGLGWRCTDSLFLHVPRRSAWRFSGEVSVGEPYSRGGRSSWLGTLLPLEQSQPELWLALLPLLCGARSATRHAVVAAIGFKGMPLKASSKTGNSSNYIWITKFFLRLFQSLHSVINNIVVS